MPTTKFDKIRPFHDYEVPAALQSIMYEPLLQSILKFAFPDLNETERNQKVLDVKTTDDFQKNIIYYALMQVLKISSEGLTTSGFEKLEKNTAYLYISNHRDILLDTSFLNLTLADFDLLLTASAIGDNLVKRPLLHTISKINRNFLVLRDLSPRELLEASSTLSDYIFQFLIKKNRSVWIAQKEGRTKDGNDATHPGVLKMLAMAAKSENPATFFKKYKIVPVSISYEYDPTDALKLPELIANLNNEPYTKADDEDFTTLYKGITGQKKRIHIHAGDVLDLELDEMAAQTNTNKQIKMLAQIIDKQIINNYHCFASNYIAYDLLYQTHKYNSKYNDDEKETFVTRMNKKINSNDKVLLHQFLGMYANPVVNQETI